VRQQASAQHGGADAARLLAVYCDSQKGRFYREPSQRDLDAFAKARTFVDERRKLTLENGTPMVPDEELPYLRSIFNINLIGVSRWDQMFSSRQLASLLTLAELVRACFAKLKTQDSEFATAVATVLACAVDRQADYSSSICTWVQSGEFIGHTFAQGQSLPIKWDFAEVAPFADGSGNWDGAIEWIARVLEEVAAARSLGGNVQKASATEQPLPQ
jgi:putative DNA methylase